MLIAVLELIISFRQLNQDSTTRHFLRVRDKHEDNLRRHPRRSSAASRVALSLPDVQVNLN